MRASLRPVWLPPAERRIVAGMNEKSRLAVIVGSVREGRFGPVIASWVAERAREHGAFDVDVIDLADIEIPLSLPVVSPKVAGENYPRPAVLGPVTARLAAADAFLVVTPEYNHSYPAPLKALIDWYFTQWTAKPVAFASYGGEVGGRHAVLHLENVFTELNAVPIRAGLVFSRHFVTWKDGAPLDAEATGRAKELLERLAWWADALRAARAAAPFPGAA